MTITNGGRGNEISLILTRFDLDLTTLDQLSNLGLSNADSINFTTISSARSLRMFSINEVRDSIAEYLEITGDSLNVKGFLKWYKDEGNPTSLDFLNAFVHTIVIDGWESSCLDEDDLKSYDCLKQ